MRTLTISNSFSYMVGAPDVDIQISRDIAARDVTEKFKAADLKRGWGKTCSKSCAASLREFNRRKSNG